MHLRLVWKVSYIEKEKYIKETFIFQSLTKGENAYVLFLVHIPLLQYMLAVALWINEQILTKLNAKSVFFFWFF